MTLDGTGEFVLKVFQAGEDPGLLDCQARLLDRLQASELPFRFPRVRDDLRRGSRAAVARDADGVEYPVRLVDWVPGVPVTRARPHTSSLFRAMGTMMGAVNGALADFTHPAADREFDWDLARAPEVVDRLVDEVEGPERRALVRHFQELFRREVEPRAPDLPVQVIHGDANDHNVLVRPRLEDPLRPLAVEGLVDFGDVVRSWRVGEPAVTSAYALLDRSDPLGAVESVLRGYLEALHLEEEEVDALFPLVSMRLCVSVVHSAHRRRLRPDDEYVTVSEAPAWRALERLYEVDPGFARYRLRAASGRSPTPTASKVVRWLKRNAGAVGPLVARIGPTPSPSRPEIVDLSLDAPGRPPLLDGEGGSDEDRPAPLRVGRYGEVRWIPAERGPNPRTLHLGLDLFLPEGTPIQAPLAGWVVDVEPDGEEGPALLLRHEVSGEGIVFHTRYAGLTPAGEGVGGVGRRVEKGDVLGRVAARGLSGEGDADGPATEPHLHVQLVTDPVGRGASFPGMVPPRQEALWRALSPDPNLLLGLPGVGPAAGGRRTAELLKTRRRVLGPNLSVSYRRPLHILRGWMQHLYDADGRAYLDGVNNVAHVGHQHPRVVAAIRRQAEVLNTNTRYLHGEILRLADRLCGLLPDPLSVCYLVCSGSEANELALRLARVHTGRRAVLVTEGAYHGNTTTLVGMSPYKYRGPGGRGPGPHVHEVPLPDPFRGRYRSSDAGLRYAEEVKAVAAKAAREGDPPAALFCESLPGCAGQIVPPAGYLESAFRAVRQAGAVAVADEVQTGFGRVGTHLWAFEAQGAVPDIVTLGKPMGNGHPVSAVVTTREIAESFDTGMEYFNTFGGNPVSAAAASAVLDVLEEERLPGRARVVGQHLRRGLEGVQARRPLVGDVRGMGLFVGVELVQDPESRTPAPDHAAYVVERLRAHRILTSVDGADANVLKIKPPLVFDEDDADRLVEALDRILAEDPVRLD